MPDCYRCGDPARESISRSSTGQTVWLCPVCLTALREWLQESDWLPKAFDDATESVPVVERVARVLWDERWTIKINHWADGDRQVYAICNRGLVDPDSEDERYERDSLFVHEGEYHVRREHIRQEQGTVVEPDLQSGFIDELLNPGLDKS